MGRSNPWATLTKCGIWGDMVDVITCAIFRDCRLRGVGVVRGVSLPSPIDLTRRPYNTGHTVCDRVILSQNLHCNRILCTSKSEAAVTCNKKKLRCMLKLTTDKHEAVHGLSTTAELLVLLVPVLLFRLQIYRCEQLNYFLFSFPAYRAMLQAVTNKHSLVRRRLCDLGLHCMVLGNCFCHFVVRTSSN